LKNQRLEENQRFNLFPARLFKNYWIINQPQVAIGLQSGSVHNTNDDRGS